MGGLGHVLAGAMQGFGKGIENEANALREQAIEEARQAREDRRAAEDRSFRSQEATREMNYRSSEAEKERGWRTKEAIADNDRMTARQRAERDAQESEIAGEDGTVYVRRGDKATTVKDENGNPVRGATRSRRGLTGSEGMSDTEWRQRYAAGMEAGVSGDLTSGGQDWNKTIRKWRSLDIDPNEPKILAEIEGDLYDRAAEQGLQGPKADAFVSKEMQKLGLGEGAGAAPAVGLGTDAAPAKSDLGGSGQESVTRVPQNGSSAAGRGPTPSDQGSSTYTRQNPAKPQTSADFQALPPGAVYVNPADGKLYEKK